MDLNVPITKFASIIVFVFSVLQRTSSLFAVVPLHSQYPFAVGNDLQCEMIEEPPHLQREGFQGAVTFQT